MAAASRLGLKSILSGCLVIILKRIDVTRLSDVVLCRVYYIIEKVEPPALLASMPTVARFLREDIIVSIIKKN